jgi:superfamily II DNA or RNA helicase
VADLGDRFPGTEIQAEAYDMGKQATEEIRAVYEEMRREIARLEERASHDATHANVLVEILRARQRAELLKVPALVEMTRDAVEEGMSVALFLNFDASIEAASRRLGRLGTRTITGADKLDERQRVIDRFNDDGYYVVICNIKAGGVGVSLQGKAGGRPRLALISPTYSAIDFKQALGRVHRAGGVASVQKVVFAADTVEAQACAKVRRKLRHIETLNDGDLAV